MAEAARRDPGTRQLLCLVSPRMTEERIGEQWRLMGRVLRPEVVRRLSLHVVRADGRGHSFGDVPDSMAARTCVVPAGVASQGQEPSGFPLRTTRSPS